MNDVVLIDAVRSPMGKRNGMLARVHPVELLGQVLRGLMDRNGLHTEVDQVIGGCVSQAGMQASNITRWAWLTAGLPIETGATTIDSQCGSSQQAMSIGSAMIAAGQVRAVVCCGVESMSGVPMGSPVPKDGSLGTPVTDAYTNRYEYTSQFDSADRIAKKWAISRADCDLFAKQSQDKAAAAIQAGVFDEQIIAISATDDNGVLVTMSHDQGPRPTTLEGLARLTPINAGEGVHTAGNSSQMTDAASAVLLMSRRRAEELGMSSLATIIGTGLVGSDPVLKLTGPIAATSRVLAAANMAIDDVGVVEINEAFASVVLAWLAEHVADPALVNPNGGAIALGHPLGATGGCLITKSVHELVRSHQEHALVTICCGGGMATATLLRRT